MLPPLTSPAAGVAASAGLPRYGLSLLSIALVACANGTLDPDAETEMVDDDDAMEPLEPPAGPDLPSEVVFEVDAGGSYPADELGFSGQWQSETGTDSSVELSFDADAVCLNGTTAQVPEGGQTTHFGARASFNLCQNAEGEPLAVSDCLDTSASREFIGVAFTLAGDVLPRRISVEFNEAGRSVPGFLWFEEGGEYIALFERVTNPFDSSSPSVKPDRLQSISVRAVGSSQEPRSFDFCVEGLRALFGDEWRDALIPDWLDEPGPGQQVPHVGANLVGAEFGEQNLPGEYGTDYIYPGPDEVVQYVSRGMNTFRLPFRWERMQREPYADLHASELGYLKQTIEAAREHNATVIVDPHNFARYAQNTDTGLQSLVVGVDLEVEAFADFWAKLAREFAGDELVWFGLMNEPHSMPTETWLDAANAAIAAIRDAGADNLVLVPGNQWTGAHAWFENYYGTPNSEVLTGVVDPLNNFAFEVHQYFDSSSSGTSNTCVSDSIGVERVQGVTEWLRSNEFQGFMGEFGGSDDPSCLGAMDGLLTHLGENSDVWLGWTVWAASQWNIQHNIRPRGGVDSLQLEVLYRHMDR